MKKTKRKQFNVKLPRPIVDMINKWRGEMTQSDFIMSLVVRYDAQQGKKDVE